MAENQTTPHEIGLRLVEVLTQCIHLKPCHEHELWEVAIRLLKMPWTFRCKDGEIFAEDVFRDV